ncbi:hypothetical protein FOZ63_020611 [Perkinsus olseni]|uniref:Uncharacterized protein n=1 Tax=Perkinsus olseni TaxID=32597 RepID=A0A7J6QJ59_PEROL|nr:hypothetical protein FOZ63_020611 [Perkinsus olseni]
MSLDSRDRRALIEKAMELQKTLSEMTYRAEEVRLQNAALGEENDLLKEYIESFITRLGEGAHLGRASATLCSPPSTTTELTFSRPPRPRGN